MSPSVHHQRSRIAIVAQTADLSKIYERAAAGVAALPLLFLSLLLPEVGRSAIGGALQKVRRVLVLVAPRVALLVGGAVTGLLLHVMPPVDWFTFSGGMIHSMNVRWETLQLGTGIILMIGLLSSLWPAWTASRLSVLDGLRTLE